MKTEKRKVIKGECKKCGSCCYFSYWIGPSDDTIHEYMGQFFNNYEVIPTGQASLVIVRDIPCKHLDEDSRLCKIHDQKRDWICEDFPHSFDPCIFEMVRPRDCGFYVIEEEVEVPEE